MLFQNDHRGNPLALSLLFSNVALAALHGLCPPLGPVVPAPINPSLHGSVKAAIASASDKFQNLTAGLDSTAISIAVKSIHESHPLLELHHTPPVLDPSGVNSVDSDTIYRIGSISKLFAVLAVLTEDKIKWEDSITKYVPELLKLNPKGANAITAVDWKHVTVGALASHMGGIGADLAQDLSSFPGDFTQLGLPKLTSSSKTGCAGLFGLPPCAREEFFRDFGKRPPVYAPYANPVYSNVGFSILGFAIESATGMSYDAYVEKAIFRPLKMPSTSIFKAPKDKSSGFISKDDIWFGASIGYEDIAGGMYSNTKDMLSLGVGILQNRILSPVTTRKWMKPVTSTSASGMLVGGPWEILRSDTVTKDQRMIEYYTKSGGLGSYNSIICLIPDYNIVVTILSGGGESSGDLVNVALSETVKTLLPAIEDASKTEAKLHFWGTFSDPATNSSITLALDDGPGVAVTKWMVRDVDILKNYASFNGFSSGQGDADGSQTDINSIPIRVRISPTGLDSANLAAWRAYVTTGSPEDIRQTDEALFWSQGSCVSWGTVDRLVYGFKAIDEFVFTIDENHNALRVSLPAFDIILERQA